MWSVIPGMLISKNAVPDSLISGPIPGIDCNEDVLLQLTSESLFQWYQSL